LTYRLLPLAHLPVAAAFALACALGVACTVFGATLPRKLAIAIGFPLSLLLSGSAVLPAWAWLLPVLLIGLVYPLNAWRDAPLFPTPARALVDLPRHIRLPAGAAILDAGCGLGDGLKALRGAFPEARFFGIEWSWPLRALAALRCPWARIRQGDIWRADWSAYELVYLFQRPESMPRAVAKASQEMQPGRWMVSLEFPAEELQATASIKGADGRPAWLYQAPFKRARKR
jgi:SAM-dependent methyltransferase